MYDTVIFDLDGTLLNTLDDLRDSTNYALASFGFPERTTDEIRRFVGNGIRKLIERAVPEGTSKEVTDEVLEKFKEHYNIHCNDKTGPYQGIPELLLELKKRGIKMGIATNKVKSAADKLNEIYFDGFIDEVAGVEEGIIPKPDKMMINNLMNRLNASKETTLYIGDSQVDVQTAANAGLKLIAVLWGFRNRDELIAEGASVFVKEPMEIMNYIISH